MSLSIPLGLPATPETVHALISAHRAAHRALPESARLRDLGAERALVQDYSGRVVFELLQNALDRAKERIDIRWDTTTKTLEVANDGLAITTESVAAGRSDLTALLTLHTSSKSAQESVGNKGVGFRSVFASAAQVEVSSRAADGNWWGMSLRHPTSVEEAPENWSEAIAASFYHPAPHQAEGRDGHSTVIRLRDVRNVEVVSTSIRELQRGPLTFLEARGDPGLCIRITSDEVVFEHTLGVPVYAAIEPPEKPKRVEMSQAVRDNTGLDLPHGEVRVLFEHMRPSDHRSRYWSYLPTEQPAGFGVQIQADFYLSNSRRNLALRPLHAGAASDDPAGWNAGLVEVAADCIIALWQRPEVCVAADFWQVATPSACECAHLKLAVARRLWNENGKLFKTMTSLSFPPGGTWPLRRYRQLFTALYSWADYAYQRLGRSPRVEQIRLLLGHVQDSGASVLPITMSGPQDEDTAAAPEIARPLKKGEKGQQKGPNADRLFYLPHNTNQIALPRVVADQRTFVTAFYPNVGATLGEQGLLTFDRLEILAQLRPAETHAAHGELLAAVWDLATDGGSHGSLLQRAQGSGAGAYWRFVPISENVQRAGGAIGALCVPTLDGEWVAARDCGTARGPWPVVDLSMLNDALPSHPDLEALLMLLGVGPVPLGQLNAIDLPPSLDASTAADLLDGWRRIDSFLTLEQGAGLRVALCGCRWLWPSDELDILQGVDQAPPPYRPVDVWAQQPSRGFTTELLPRLVGSSQPSWAIQLGIVNPRDERQDVERLQAALSTLRRLDRQQLHAHQRDLIELYRALVRAALTLPAPPFLPLLCRPVDDDGQRLPVRWAQESEEVWYEPQRADVEALRSFRGVLHWVVRRQSTAKVQQPDLWPFQEHSTKVVSHGAPNTALANDLRTQLTDALPELLAAADAFHAEFDGRGALETFAAVVVRQFEDVWVEWKFRDKVGTRGKQEDGDVFIQTCEDQRRELWFDGGAPPLAQCAYPLSELFAGNRLFGPLFKDALHAVAAGPRAIARFRREQGLSADDVRDWRERVESSIMPAEERTAWVQTAQAILNDFGTVLEPPTPGMVITPRTFNDKRDCTERQVEDALAALPRLQPRVSFHHFHLVALELADRTPLLAEIAERNRDRWTEKQLNDWKCELEKPAAEEDEERHRLTFDVQASLRRRLRLPVERVEPTREAWSFARGQIPLKNLPSPESGALSLQGFRPHSADMTARDAADDETFIRQARRRANGGRRAEDAVLDLAVTLALEWRRRSSSSFNTEFERLLKLLESKGSNKVRERLDVANDEACMRKLLHVAEYVGNAGFDVLVPRNDKWLLVEIKRVSAMSRAVFFLSENERRRARRYVAEERQWRLWLVAGTGESVDATDLVLSPFKRHEAAIGAMGEDGLRPGEWFFVTR